MIRCKKGIVISGFAGIGKSGLKENVPYYDNVKIFDLSSSYFRKNPGWEEFYCDIVESLVDNYDFIFISAHDIVIREMIRRRNDFYIVYPKRHCKEEYRERFIKRGNSKEYIDKFMKNWNCFIDLLDNIDYDKKITLRTGQYLSDVLNRLR
jgi:guanylate kinase